MKFDDIPHVARYLMDKWGLLAPAWNFEWDNARRRAGQCRYRGSGKFGTITLSRHYVLLNVDERPDDVLDTILHEIAHGLVPGDGHGSKWKEKAVEVGARPTRCYDSSVIQMPKGRYAAVCRGCQKEYRCHKRPKDGRYRYCWRCGDGIGRLTYADTAAPGIVAVEATIDTNPPTPKKLRGT